MKNTIKLIGIIAIIAMIAFSMFACNNETPDPCANGHAFPEWTAPTCTEDGNSLRTCSRCTQTDTRTEGYTALGCHLQSKMTQLYNLI